LNLQECKVTFIISESRNFGPNITAPVRFDYGDYMTSNNSQYHAIMQPDGNFVVYRGSLADRPTDAWWTTKTNQRSNGPYHMELQQDNNLVLYDIYKMPLWRAKTDEKGIPPARLYLLDNGNLVLVDATNRRLWSSERELKGRANRAKPKKRRKPTWQQRNGWS
jgi:hypothetical protein